MAQSPHEVIKYMTITISQYCYLCLFMFSLFVNNQVESLALWKWKLMVLGNSMMATHRMVTKCKPTIIFMNSFIIQGMC